MCAFFSIGRWSELRVSEAMSKQVKACKAKRRAEHRGKDKRTNEELELSGGCCAARSASTRCSRILTFQHLCSV